MPVGGTHGLEPGRRLLLRWLTAPVGRLLERPGKRA